jgi:plastocyanin
MRWLLRSLPVVAGLAVGAAVLGPGLAQGRPVDTATPLAATVNAKTEIVTIKTANGTLVGNDSAIPPGSYTIAVDDQANIHNLHLVGPGVDEATTVEFVGKTTWNVTLQPGLYHYSCDAHANLGMMNQFYVGTAPAPVKLTATVSPKGKITVVGPGGPISPKHPLPSGTVALTVVDRSKKDNFHLRDNGGFVSFDRASGKRFVGTQHWTVNLRSGQTYTYLDDAKFVAAGYIVVAPLAS